MSWQAGAGGSGWAVQLALLLEVQGHGGGWWAASFHLPVGSRRPGRSPCPPYPLGLPPLSFVAVALRLCPCPGASRSFSKAGCAHMVRGPEVNI